VPGALELGGFVALHMTRVVKRMVVLGASAVALGAGLLGTAVVASAPASASTACKVSCSVTATPNTGIPVGKASFVTVAGTGFAAKSPGAVIECNTTPGQPTVTVSNFKTLPSLVLPVGCSAPGNNVVSTDASGAFTYALAPATGTVGPPIGGNDSSGKPAATDAVNYPCPPYPGQSSCAVSFVDKAGETASTNIAFNPTTTPPTTTTTTPASTTTQACNAVAQTASAVNGTTGTTGTVTVTPGTCLVGNEPVTVTATGLVPNSIGSILECNTDGSSGAYGGTAGATVASIAAGSLVVNKFVGKPPATGSVTIAASGGNATLSYSAVNVVTSSATATFTGLALVSGQGTWTVAANAAVNQGQPTITYLGNAIPVSCTAVKIFTTTASGGIAPSDQAFTVVEGVTGPPTTGLDSSGNQAAADAQNYPCPPTTAQIAAGDGCVIAVGDIAGDKVPVPITFNTGAPPEPTTTTTAATTASSSANQSGTTSAGSSTSPGGGTLAFTGSGPRLWWVALVGIMLVVLGGILLVMADLPRRLVRLAANKARTRGRD